jgi:hypothetical protein
MFWYSHQEPGSFSFEPYETASEVFSQQLVNPSQVQYVYGPHGLDFRGQQVDSNQGKSAACFRLWNFNFKVERTIRSPCLSSQGFLYEGRSEIS